MTPNSAAFAQWMIRSAPSNRSTVASSGWADEPGASGASGASGDGGIAPAVRPADPGVDVVAPVLPVARLDLVGHGDAAQPLAGLVAVHRGDVQADGSTVGLRERLVGHRVGDEDV